MKTHMMGVGMTFFELVVTPALGLADERDCGHVVGGDAAGGEAGVAYHWPVVEPRVLEEQLSVLIPKEDGGCDRSEERVKDALEDAGRALEVMVVRESNGAESATYTEKSAERSPKQSEGETGIFSFKEVEFGVFELRELTRDRRPVRKRSLIESIRRL